MTRARNSANLASDGNLFVNISDDRTGIGSLSPTHKLHVAGTSFFDDDVLFRGANTGRNCSWDKSTRSLVFDGNNSVNGNYAKAQFSASGSYSMDVYNNLNNFVEVSPNVALFVKTCDLQVLGSGNRSGNTYDGAILRARQGIVELGHEISNGGATGYKLATTAYGVNVTGTTDTDGLIVSGVATVTTMNVTGVLTYDDVTSVDSVGIITAREGVIIPDNKALSLGNRVVGSTAGDLRLYHDGSNSYIDEIGSGNLFIRNGSDTAIFCQTDGTVKLHYDGSEKLATSSTGVSITGAIASSGNLSISNVAPKIFLTDTDSNSDFSIRNMHGVFGIHDQTNSVDRLAILSTGHTRIENDLNALASINTASNYHLHLSNPANDVGEAVGICFGLSTGGDIGASIYHSRTGSNSYGDLMFATKPSGGGVTERARIDSNGRLLVGATAVVNNSIAEFHRDIGGGAEGCHILVNNTSTNSVNNTARLKLRTSGGTAQLYAFAAASTVLTSRAAGTADLSLRADGSSKLRLYTNGNERLFINSSGHVVPGADSTYDLGLTGTRFRNVYADTLYGDGANITNVNATTLDSIDSGSFLRSDAADTASGDIGFSGGAGAVTINAGSDIRLANGNWTGNAVAKIQHHNDFLYISGGTAGIIFRENDTNRWSIDGDGHFDPSTDSTFDIGQSDRRVRNGYFDTLYGDGSNLTGITQTTINNNADNRVITGSGTANTLNAESTLTFNAGSLVVNSNNTISGSSIITYSPGGDVRWQMGVNNSTGVDLTSKNTSGSYNTYQINAGTFKVRTTGTNSPADRFIIDGNGNIKHTSATGLSYFTGSSEYVFGSITSSPSSGGSEAKLQIHDSKTRATLSINGYMNNAGAPVLQFISSRSGTIGTLGTKAALNDYHGDIRFFGDNGTNYQTLVQSAQILVRQKSTISDGDTVCAGEMSFYTGTDSAGSLLERLKIDSGGRLTLLNSEGIKLSAKTSSLYAQDGTLSYYGTSNAVYLNGAGANGWLRLNASGVTNSRTCIDIYGQSAASADIILFKTNSGERMRILQNGQIEVKADEGIFLKPVTNGGAGGTNGARIRFSDNSGASHNQIGEFRYQHSDSSVVSAAQNDGVNSNDAFYLFGSETLTMFRIDASTHIYNDYGLWVKTTTQGGLSSNGARIRFSSNPSTNYNQIGEISYLHDDNGITTGFVDGFRIKGSDGQANQQYGAQKTIVKVNGSLQATGNVWGVGSVCQIVRGTDQIINNQNPNQSLQEIASGFRTSITLRTVNPYIKVTFYANPELDGASMRAAIYFYVKKNSGGYSQFQRPVWFGSTTDSGNQQGGYSMLGVVGTVTGNRGDTFTFSPYWAEEANSTAQYMFGQTWSQWGTMASFMYLEEIATQ